MPTLEITTMIGCPLMCTFCPQETLRDGVQNEHKYMSYENFEKIIKKIPKHVRIDFSGMAEPWANKDCTRMLEHVLREGYDVAIYTTLYGIKIDEVDYLIHMLLAYKSQIKQFVIHLQDKNGNMKGMKITEEWCQVLDKFLILKEDNLLECMSFMTMDKSGVVDEKLIDLQRFVPKFNGIARAGSLDLDKISGQDVLIIKHVPGIIKCARWDYYNHNILLPSGDVLVCCMDYGKKHVIGNLLSSEYYDLYKSPAFLEFLSSNMDPDNRDSICRKCECAVPAHEVL